jgi:DNA-binding NarL/FixJ family response regulator
MTGGTLMASRAVNLHSHIKKRLETLGFDNVTVTASEKDGLNMQIRELKPRIVLMGSMFYQCCTPFMMSDLHKQFPKLNIAGISVFDFPDDLAMYFIINGAKSYVSLWEGAEQFYKGLEEIRRGHEYVSPQVQRRIDMRPYYPNETGRLTPRQIEIIRLICNGFTGAEIADTLHMSVRRVDNSKSEIYTALNVRNENETIRAAIVLGIINPEELNFFGREYVLKPLPTKTTQQVGGKITMSNEQVATRKLVEGGL